MTNAAGGQYYNLILPLPPTNAWAMRKYADRNVPAIQAFFWQEIQKPSATAATGHSLDVPARITALLDQGWALDAQPDAGSLILRRSDRLTNLPLQLLVLFILLAWGSLIGILYLINRTFKGYEPGAVRLRARWPHDSAPPLNDLPAGWALDRSQQPPMRRSWQLAAILEYVIPGLGVWYGGSGSTAVMWLDLSVALWVTAIVGGLAHAGGLAAGAVIAYLLWTALRTMLVVGAVNHNNNAREFAAMYGK